MRLFQRPQIRIGGDDKVSIFAWELRQVCDEETSRLSQHVAIDWIRVGEDCGDSVVTFIQILQNGGQNRVSQPLIFGPDDDDDGTESDPLPCQCRHG